MTDARPSVAMVVNNGMANDARVVKSALTLARAGARVTVLGVASPGQPRQEGTAGGVRFVRLPVLPARGLTWGYLAYAVRRRLGRLVPATSWRTALPVTRLYERGFADDLRALDPDVVHVHDVHLLDAVRAALPGVPVVYDAHEYVAGLAVSGARTQRAVTAWAALEAERIGSATKVVTVSEAIADRLLAEQSLAERPAVVYNAPIRWPVARTDRSIRADAGAPADAPLAVYSGAVSEARGVDTVIRALPFVPGLHLVVVAVPHPHPMAPGLLDLAGSLGVGDRVRVAPPVPSHEVPAYLSGADLGVSPIRGDAASYDMALPNKLFEFLHAGLTVVTSDLAAMSEFVRENHLGEVFRQGDPRACAEAMERALAAPARDDEARRRLAETYSWQGQEARLVDVYRRMAADAPALATLVDPVEPWREDELVLDFHPA